MLYIKNSTGVTRTVFLWYPADSASQNTPIASTNAAPLAGTFPVLLFSHGLTGCGNGSLFLTESLARSGYIVVAINHDDYNVNRTYALEVAGPSVGSTLLQWAYHYCGQTKPPFTGVPSNWGSPSTWTPSTWSDRRADMEWLLNSFASLEQAGGFAPGSFDSSRIGVIGYSLGGSIALGLSGGWPTWKDNRIKAGLYLSPDASPVSLSSIAIPSMIQIEEIGDYGTYYGLSAPKYFLVLQNATHFAFMDYTCKNYSTPLVCADRSPTAGLIVQYSLAFFDHYLKQAPPGVLYTNPSGFASYEFDKGKG